MTLEMQDVSIDWVMDDEGGELNRVPSCPTKWGVSLADLSNHRALGVVIHDLQDLSRREAREVLSAKWKALGCNSFPPGIDYLLFDSAIVCSNGVSINWAYLSYEQLCRFHQQRRSLYYSKERGEFLQGIRRCGDLSNWLLYCTIEELRELVRQFLLLRRRRHRSEAGWATQFQQRTNRCNRVSRRALDKLQLWKVAAASEA